MEKQENRKNPTSVRIAVSLPFPLLQMLDDETQRRGYNRSEAIRTAVRDQLERWTGRKL